MRKQFIDVPLPLECNSLCAIWCKLVGVFLTPFFLLMAVRCGCPGMQMRVRFAVIGTKLFLGGRISLRSLFLMLFSPMDSTRYFEFQSVWERTAKQSFSSYLDVSSPRYLPLFLMRANANVLAKLLNPDAKDLAATTALATQLGVSERCEFFNDTLASAPLRANSFDLITCISVLEHIPEDSEAVKIMWNLLKPGGRLILTFPCRSAYLEQYISSNEYGILSPDDSGYVFWQRYYTEERIREVILPVTGPPSYQELYGEKRDGLFYRDATLKRLFGAGYPFWREPYMMAREYRHFSSVSELPGEGVMLLEFSKTLS